MNWLPLRKNNIPLIDRQIEKAITIHQEIQQSIMEGDILSVQKMSDLQLSIKKRIQEIDQFYNKNCFDQRVRFLQGARMKLSRLINQSIINDKQINIRLPWKQTNDITASRQSNSSSKKSMTPRKKILKNEKVNNQRQTPNIQKQLSKSPLNRSYNNRQEHNQPKIKNKKMELTLNIPDDDPNEGHVTFSGIIAGTAQPKKQVFQKMEKSRRKMELIPSKNRSSANIVEDKKNKSPISNIGAKIQQNSKLNPPKIKIIQPPAAVGSSRTKTANNTGRTHTVTQGSNGGNSIKLLNDLIFTIKMTKQQYEDFIQIKKKLNQR